jgi:murein DD-endopeptidase MepM/ murein hydrolase activator NlpD
VESNRGGVRHDYKAPPSAITRFSRTHWLPFAAGLGVPLAVLIVVLALKPTHPPPAPSAATVGPVLESPSADHETGAAIVSTPPEPATVPILVPSYTALELLVTAGDTLELLFKRNGLNLADLAAIISLPEAGSALKLLKPGDRLEIAHHDGEVESLRREIDDARLLSITRGETGFAATTIRRELDIRTTAAHGVIDSSLFEAGVAAGMSDKVTMDMAGIFQWDIDFVQDVRDGDQFTVIYEEIWRDGVKVRNGQVVAAEFVNQGTRYRAARYRDASGHVDYYNPEGRSMRKAFIRAPVDFTRISSNFNSARRHPILNTIRAHRGVDYAAPIGTPVWAAGDGKVIFRGVQGGYGNVLVVQHGGNVTTLYGHLSRFANARVGSRVRQGEIIAYVGKSGLATGPHLHYEYRVNGVHRNPRTVPLPAAEPVPREYREDFTLQTSTLWRQLDRYESAVQTTAAN